MRGAKGWQLVGTEYIPKALLRRMQLPSQSQREEGRIYWDEIPMVFRATEARLRASIGASDPKYLMRILSWNGCRRAIHHGTMGGDGPHKDSSIFRPCEKVADESGFCKAHKATGIEDLGEL